MAIAQVRRRGAYAPLSATYFVDDDIMEAGEEAELLYVRSLAFSAGNPDADGYITDKQVSRVIGAGMEELPERVKALVAVGLWERLPGGYVVRSWLKWNKSAQELGRHRARDRDRKSAKSDTDDGTEGGDDGSDFRAEEGVESEPDSEPSPHGNGGGIPTAAVTEVGADSATGGARTPDDDDLESEPSHAPPHTPDTCAATQHNTTQQEEKNSSSPDKPATVNKDLFGDVAEPPGPAATRRSWSDADLDADPNWVAFWNAYPKKADKGHARKAWIAIMKKGGVDADDLTAGAQRYRDWSGRDPNFTKNGATWLNGECWNDEHAVEAPAAGPRPFWEN